MRTKGIAALAAVCFLVLVALPIAEAEAEADDGPYYRSQLDADGQAVYDAVAKAFADAQADPADSLTVTVNISGTRLFSQTPEYQAYAEELVVGALATLYYTDPMAVWLWDLPVSAPEVTAGTEVVTVSDANTESGSMGIYRITSVTFTVTVPEDMRDDPETEENELLQRMDAVRDAAEAVEASGSAPDTVRGIARALSSVTVSEDGEGEVSNIYDALVTRESSSAGIAAAVTYLCGLNGVEALTVRGTVHTSFTEDGTSTGYWNTVMSDGSWYGCDVTWYRDGDRSPLMAGFSTETVSVAAGERFGATHVPDLAIAEGVALASPEIALEGHQWPDESGFLERYGTYIFSGIIVAIIVAAFVYAIRKGNV